MFVGSLLSGNQSEQSILQKQLRRVKITLFEGASPKPVNAPEPRNASEFIELRAGPFREAWVRDDGLSRDLILGMSSLHGCSCIRPAGNESGETTHVDQPSLGHLAFWKL